MEDCSLCSKKILATRVVFLSQSQADSFLVEKGKHRVPPRALKTGLLFFFFFILSIVAFSAPSERAFSVCRHL